MLPFYKKYFREATVYEGSQELLRQSLRRMKYNYGWPFVLGFTAE